MVWEHSMIIILIKHCPIRGDTHILRIPVYLNNRFLNKIKKTRPKRVLFTIKNCQKLYLVSRNCL